MVALGSPPGLGRQPHLGPLPGLAWEDLKTAGTARSITSFLSMNQIDIMVKRKRPANLASVG